ncbi:MAG TPA: diacylglycerol kinase family protein [Planctomycetota bacterium]|nr:diacylglycerol kinase family protein [Planctomycetota bacterium]
MSRRIKIIANPVSGRGRGTRLGREVADCLRAQGADPILAQTLCAGDACRLAGEPDDCFAVAGVGGDGTINEVLNGLREGAALGMIPCGTANVLAKELRLPRDAAGLARVLASGREVPWDLGADAVTGRKFLLFASAGYDAHVVHRFHAARKGPIRMTHYLASGLRCMIDYVPPRIRVELDGRALAGEASWVIVSNVASYGGPLVFTPRAAPADGTFEVLVLRGNRRRDVVRMFWRALAGWLLRRDFPLAGASFHRARRVRLLPGDDGRVPVQIDGDPGGFLPAEFVVRPAAVRLLAP